MFYNITETGAREVALQEITPQDVTVGYLTLEELHACGQALGFSAMAIQECETTQTHFRNSLDIYNDFSFGVINIVDVRDVHAKRDRVAVFLKHNLFVMVKLIDEDESIREMFESAVRRYKTAITLEKVIYGVLERLLDNGYQAIEATEKRILAMERALVEHRMDESMNREIFDFKTRLTTQKNFYEQLVDIGEELMENENDLFDEDELRYFKIFTDKAARLVAGTQSMCENLVHVREAHQAALDYELNRVMKMFTVVTTIFLPLTLIVGWYGMNFEAMPELSWEYGYPTVILLSVAVVAVCIYVFKKKKLM